MNQKFEVPNDPPNIDVMDEFGAAKYIGVCDKTLRKLRQASKIPHARVGGRIVYLRAQLYAWLAAGGTNSQAKVK